MNNYFASRAKSSTTNTTEKLLQDDSIKEVQSARQQNQNLYTSQDPLNQTFNLEQNLHLDIRCWHKDIFIDSQQTQVIPGTISVEVQDPYSTSIEKKKQSLDLVLIIDTSVSMRGERIKMVQESIIKLLYDEQNRFLGPEDRLCLITFNSSAQKLTPFLFCNQQNKKVIEEKIKGLMTVGGTNIEAGMQLAIKSILQREEVNEMTTVFLLSDGEDNNRNSLKNIRQVIKDNNLQNQFSLHTLGYGLDYDQKLMNDFSDIQGGNSFNIIDIKKIDQAFACAVGQDKCVIGKDIQLVIKLNDQMDIVQSWSIDKTYGDNWREKGQDNTWNIHLPQMIAGVKKTFVFELKVPAIQNIDIQQYFDMQVELLKAKLTCVSNSGQNYEESKSLFVTLKTLPQGLSNNASFLSGSKVFKESIPELQLSDLRSKQNSELEGTSLNHPRKNYIQEYDDFVLQETYRVRAAEAFNEAIRHADNKDFQESHRVLDQIQQEVKQTPIFENNQVLNAISKDIDIARQNIDQGVYDKVGKKNLFNMYKGHLNQKPQIINDHSQFLYTNELQNTLIEYTKYDEETGPIIIGLKKDLLNALKQIKTLQMQSKSMQNEEQLQQREIQQLKAEAEKLKESLVPDLREDVKQFEYTVEDKENMITLLKKENQLKDEQLSQIITQLEEVQPKLNESMQIQIELDQTLQQLEVQQIENKNLEAQLNDYKKLLKSSQEENFQLKQIIHKKETDLSSLERSFCQNEFSVVQNSLKESFMNIENNQYQRRFSVQQSYIEALNQADSLRDRLRNLQNSKLPKKQILQQHESSLQSSEQQLDRIQHRLSQSTISAQNVQTKQEDKDNNNNGVSKHNEQQYNSEANHLQQALDYSDLAFSNYASNNVTRKQSFMNNPNNLPTDQSQYCSVQQSNLQAYPSMYASQQPNPSHFYKEETQQNNPKSQINSAQNSTNLLNYSTSPVHSQNYIQPQEKPIHQQTQPQTQEQKGISPFNSQSQIQEQNQQSEEQEQEKEKQAALQQEIQNLEKQLLERRRLAESFSQ